MLNKLLSDNQCSIVVTAAYVLAHAKYGESTESLGDESTEQRWTGRYIPETLRTSRRLRTFILDIGTHPAGMALPRTAWSVLTASAPVLGVSAPDYTNGGMAPSAAYECGAEEQTVDHVVLHCPIHRPPHGLHGLRVLDAELLSTCHEIWCGQAVDCDNSLKRRSARSRQRMVALTYRTRPATVSVALNSHNSADTHSLPTITL